jgi:hypothetical protein
MFADLLDADLDAGALLLERIEPGAKLAEQPELPPLKESAELLTSLRVADGKDIGQLPSLAQRVEFIFALIRPRLSGRRRKFVWGGPNAV